MKPAYMQDGVALVQGDSMDLLQRIPTGSIDCIFADPPYFLSTPKGTTCKSGKRAAVSKGDWDRSSGISSDHEFHRSWLRRCQRILKPSGSLWVSGSHHCIFSIGWAAQQMGWRILNSVCWFKPNASPNLSCRMLTHSTETVIWMTSQIFSPMMHTFNYAELKAANKDKQLRDMWSIPVTPKSEKKHGSHPTQKPLALLRRIITASTNPGDVVLDPFIGSGTTMVAARELGRCGVGFDLNEESIKLAIGRTRGLPSAQ